MKGKDFFVMLNHPSRGYVPMDNGNRHFELAKFETAEEAKAAAENSSLGAEFGFEVFEIGRGI